MSVLARAGRELRAAFELWLLPFTVAILPYRVGIAVARTLSRLSPMYAIAAEPALQAFCSVRGDRYAREWRREYRFHLLLDHADLYWALTRSPAFLEQRLRGAPRLTPTDQPLFVLSFHYGQGLWLIRWLASQGRPPRFLSAPVTREHADSYLAFAYARLRKRVVEALAGVPMMFTGGARREIVASLTSGTTVFGLVDVPLGDAATRAPNAALLDHPVALPTGLLESAIPGTRVLILTARADSDGVRQVEAREAEVESLTIAALADELSARLTHAPAAWHFWHLWPRFLAGRTARP